MKKKIRKLLIISGAKALINNTDSKASFESSLSSSGKFRGELLNGEIFDTLLEASVVIECWRREYNQFRPHSSLGYRPPAPEGYDNGALTLHV